MKIYKYVIRILLLIVINHIIADACDPPYTERFITDIYIRGYGEECFVMIVYCCWKDANTSKLYYFVKEIIQRKFCMVDPSDEIAWSHFRTWVHNKVLRHATLHCAPQLPPCDPLPEINTKALYARCLKYRNFWFDKYPGDEGWYIGITSCLDKGGKCEKRSIVCVDYSINPPRTVILLDECEVIQEPDCGYEVPELPPPGKTWEEHWVTDCFARPCCP